MSSSEELSQYDDKPIKASKPSSDSVRQGNRPVIPRDVDGLYGVHVSNLPSGISQMELEKAFSTVGIVKVCKILETKYSPLYAFVKYSSTVEAQDALLKYNGYKLNDTVLAVRPAYISSKWKKRNASGNKSEQHETSSDDGSGRENRTKVTYSMESSDYRLRDGTLSESDVRMFNGKSSKSSPTRKKNGGQALGPRFKRGSPHTSSAAETSHVPQRISPPPLMFCSPSGHNKQVRQGMPISSSHTPPGHKNDKAVPGSVYSSAFGPYRGEFQGPVSRQNACTMENGIATITASMYNLGQTTENNNSSHNQECCALDSQKGAAQGFTSGSHVGGTGTMSWSKPVCSPSRNQCAQTLKWSPQSAFKTSVSSWSTADVVQYFSASDCAEYAGFFQEQEIDGKALMLLNRDTLLQFMKVGPALKVLQKIEELK